MSARNIRCTHLLILFCQEFWTQNCHLRNIKLFKKFTIKEYDVTKEIRQKGCKKKIYIYIYLLQRMFFFPLFLCSLSVNLNIFFSIKAENFSPNNHKVRTTGSEGCDKNIHIQTLPTHPSVTSKLYSQIQTTVSNVK